MFGLLIAYVISWATPDLYAQSKVAELRITADLENQTLPTIFQYLEQNHPIRFYYQSEKLPTTLFSLNTRDLRLEAALQQLLATTPLGFFFYRDQAIIIAPKVFIQEVYSAEYYQALERGLSATSERNTTQQLISIGDIRQLKASGKAKVSGKFCKEKKQHPSLVLL